MIISSHIFETYLQCPLKAWLLYLGEKGESNAYSNFVDKKENVYLSAGIERLKNKVQGNQSTTLSSTPINIKVGVWRLVTGITIKTDNLESHLHAIERITSKEQDKTGQIIPIRFIIANKITKNDKLLLTFDALVLSEMLKREINFCKIIYGYEYKAIKVKISPLMGEIRK
jgi:hypothetical protein